MTVIEIDDRTAALLESRAGDRGLSAADFVTMLAYVTDDAADIAESRRRSAAIAAGEQTVPHEEVARWLATWGTDDYKPWPDFR